MEMRVELTTIISLNTFLICIIHKSAKRSALDCFSKAPRMINDSWERFANAEEIHSDVFVLSLPEDKIDSINSLLSAFACLSALHLYADRLSSCLMFNSSDESLYSARASRFSGLRMHFFRAAINFPFSSKYKVLQLNSLLRLTFFSFVTLRTASRLIESFSLILKLMWHLWVLYLTSVEIIVWYFNKKQLKFH